MLAAPWKRSSGALSRNAATTCAYAADTSSDASSVDAGGSSNALALPASLSAVVTASSSLVSGAAACANAVESRRRVRRRGARGAAGSSLMVRLVAASASVAPASLGAALQLNGGRVAPGLAAPVLAAYLRSCRARLKTQEEYFIDDTYRPNPLEYRPNAVVLELTVAP